MNEQFSKLLQECIVPADQAVDYSKAEGFVIPDEKLDVAKLAELIVRECATVCWLHGSRPEVRSAVLKHFGIDE